MKPPPLRRIVRTDDSRCSWSTSPTLRAIPWRGLGRACVEESRSRSQTPGNRPYAIADVSSFQPQRLREPVSEIGYADHFLTVAYQPIGGMRDKPCWDAFTSAASREACQERREIVVREGQWKRHEWLPPVHELAYKAAIGILEVGMRFLESQIGFHISENRTYITGNPSSVERPRRTPAVTWHRSSHWPRGDAMQTYDNHFGHGVDVNPLPVNATGCERAVWVVRDPPHVPVAPPRQSLVAREREECTVAPSPDVVDDGRGNDLLAVVSPLQLFNSPKRAKSRNVRFSHLPRTRPLSNPR